MQPHWHVYNKNEGKGPWWKTAQWSLGLQWPHVYDPADASGRRVLKEGRYVGSVAKGWWKLGRSEITNYLEFETALGGEDNMAQVGLVVPFLGRFSFGVRVPRSWTKGWVYHRREWTLRLGYVGRWAELLIASDEHMRDTGMVSYYKRKREQGEESHTTRAQEWPGWHLTLQPRLKDRLFGRTICTTIEGEQEPVIVPMPEGNYPGRLKREERVWKRPRWPWIAQRRVDYWVDMDIGVPTPGKGENSWDCDDDGIFGTGGKTKAEAVANVTSAALRQRERYAGPGWEPADGWPDGIGRRVA